MKTKNTIYKKLTKLLKQFCGFGLVGVSNTLISLMVYYVLVYLGLHYLIANAAGFMISVFNSYFWNSRYIFKNKTEANAFHAFLKVFMSYGFSFCLSSILLIILVQFLGISEFIAPILKFIAVIPLNFIMNKLWAFKDK